MALDDLEKFGDKNRSFNPSEDDGILRIVQNWGNELIAQMQNRLRINNTNATSSLSSSISPKITSKPGGYRLTTMMQDYWYYVENGRKPTKGGGKGELYKNIYEWITYKREMQIKINQSPNKIAATKSLAYVITRKIHREGTKAQPFVTPSLKKVTTETLGQRIAQYIADTLGSP
jgi:hypothetical protein